MHVGVDLGFRSVVLLACFLVPVIGFFVARHKWRLAAARTEEIKRLLALASEEAARAEFEVTAGYDVVSTAAFENRNSVCAVCYCPTTTRCARCKAVRYCSGKCQIVHWRQGHRENCQPAQIVDPYVDERSDDGQKVSKKNLESNADKHEGRKSTESFSEEPAVPNPGCPSEVHCIKDEDSEDEFLADRKETNSPSGSSATSFSGFSTCASSNGSSDDVSVSESVSSFEPDRTDGHQSANDVLDMLHTSFSVDQIDQSKPLSPKFESLIDSVDGFTKPSKSNQVKANCNDAKEEQRSKSLSGVDHYDTSEVPVTESRTISSDFWGRTLDSFGSDSDDHLSDSSDSSESKISHSGSYLHLSFKSSPAPPLHTVVSGSSGSISNDALPDSTGLHKFVYRDELLEKTSEKVAKGKNSPLNFEGFTNENNGPDSKSYAFNSTETKSQPFFSSNGHKSLSSDRVLRSSDVLHSSGLIPTSLESSNHIAINCSKSLKSTAGGQISAVSNVRFPSDVRGSSVPSVKSGNGDCIEAGDTVSSQVTKSSNDGTGSKTSVFKVFDQFRGSKTSKHCPLGVGTEIAGKHTEKELFPYEVFVKLYNWNKVELHPSGLLNCGNSCYANAVLQCLAFTPPLTAYLLQGLHSKSCAKKDWCFMCEFESLILKAKEGKSPLSPIRILSQLRDNGSQLGNGREEDAHEFLRYAIDTMQSVCLTEAGVNASRPLKEETTLIGLTFGGYLRSKIKCSRCQGKSERQERMMDLTVEIEGDIRTLEEAFQRFTGTEILDGENKYQCSRCKSYEKAKKKLTILEAPNVLTIALKRFQSGKFGKINKPIRFPEILDLAPYMSGTSDKSPIYKLYGVVVHLDVMNAAFSGHYVCYVKNLQNKWFKIDDSMVTAVDLGNVLEKEAYMLLYSRCSARAPRLIRNRMISSDPKHRAIPSWITGKSTNLKSKSLPTHPSVAQFSSSKPPENSTSYPPLQRILEEDLSSDNASLVSSRSDEGSSSTDSTRYSSSTDDFSDYIFGNSGREYNSPWRTSSDSDTSSSSSPSSSKHSPLSDLNRYASSSTETISLWDGRPIGVSRGFVDSGGKMSDSFLNSDITKQFRKLANSSSSSRYKGADSERLGVNSLSNVKSRKSNCERTAGI